MASRAPKCIGRRGQICEFYSGITGFWPLGYPFQSGNLPKELLARLRGTAKQNRSRRGVRDNTGLGAYLTAATDAQMSRHCGLAADLNEVFKDRRSCNPNLRHDDAATSELNIVADLDQVIDAGAGADDGIPRRPSVDRGICTDFHVVLQYHAPELRDAQEAGFRDGEAEAFLANPCARDRRRRANPAERG